MPQVVAHHDQLGAPRQRVRRVRVTHPVRACTAQLLSGRWSFVLDRVGHQHEEPAQHARQSRLGSMPAPSSSRLPTSGDAGFQRVDVTGSPRCTRY